MTESPPSAVGATEARERFADLLGRVAYAGERIVVTRNGREVGALVPMDDYRRICRLDGATPSDAPPPATRTDVPRPPRA